MTNFLPICCTIIFLAANEGAKAEDLFAAEKTHLKNELQKIELLIKNEAMEHKAGCAKLVAESEQKQLRLYELNSANSDLETTIRLLKEREVFATAGAGENNLAPGFDKISPKEAGEWPPMAKLQAAWESELMARTLTKREGSYFAASGEEKSGRIYQIGQIAAIALEDPPMPLINNSRKWQVKAPEETFTHPFYPIAFKDAASPKKESFFSYMRAGGVLSWPIFALGLSSAFILIWHLISFAIRKNRKSKKSIHSFIKTLALIATAAPLMGLLGTILGIMATFNVLGRGTGSADPAALSQGISEALITTELGLIVALLALFSHHIVTFLAAKADKESTQDGSAT